MDEIKQPTSKAFLRKSNSDNTALKDAFLDPSGQYCLNTDLLCFSHLRWDFVFQRPQHLMGRYAKNRRVFYIEEPIEADIDAPRMDISQRQDGLHVVVPRLPNGTRGTQDVDALLADLMDDFMVTMDITEPTFWYYTPMALPFTRHLAPTRVIYDCMDELSAFKGAPPQLVLLERELFMLADHVFTGGQSLYEAKCEQHESVHAFPSSIEHAHFAKARVGGEDPSDQRLIPNPRLGFYGVIDERADLELIDGIAKLRPEWQIVLLGPVVKIDPASLPKRDNIHYLGMKTYDELPKYLAHWDVAILPFAINESTRFISPTKTPEYLAAGRPVVSTPIRDVVRPYGDQGLVHIASTPETFVKACETALHERATQPDWLARVDRFLAKNSWDQTWAKMALLESMLEDSVASSALIHGALVH